MNFEPTVAMRRLFVWAVFPAERIEFLLADIAKRRGSDIFDLERGLDDQVQGKLPKEAKLIETQVYGDICFVIEYDLPAARVAYMEKRILIAVRKACKAFWGIHKIGKTPEYRAQWRKENPL